jgi:hypothetical protein
VAVNTPVAFSPGPRTGLLAVAEQTVIMFDGYRFVWHANGEERERGDPCWPTVTVMVRDPDDYANEASATNRVISAMSYALNYEMTIETSIATGFKTELDRPTLRQPSPSLGMVVVNGPTAITVEQDGRLRLVIALFREARSANSAFYRFLGYFNALDAAFDNDEPARDGFVQRSLAMCPVPAGQTGIASDWAHYLKDNLRNAVAHAVRRPGKPVLDPDDLTDRSQLDQASGMVADLVRRRVRERWPEGVHVSYSPYA